MLRKILYSVVFTAFFLLSSLWMFAQITVRGTVYDINRDPLTAVSVLSTSGKGTFTDSNGRYIINVGPQDSIWFSYLNKPTIKYPVRSINANIAFDLSLHVNVLQLKDVKIKEKNYKLDSLRNREEYAKVFDFKRPNPLRDISVGPTGVGFSIDALIGMFQFRKNKRMELFQKRLIEQEQDHFVDYRFNKKLVKQLTGLDSAELDTFMMVHRPPYEFTANSSEYDFRDFIRRAARIYRMSREMKKEE